MDNLIDDSDKLKPCPFCGAESDIMTVPNEYPDFGAMFVLCRNTGRMASSALIYPSKEDAKPLLIERWIDPK